MPLNQVDHINATARALRLAVEMRRAQLAVRVRTTHAPRCTCAVCEAERAFDSAVEKLEDKANEL